MENTCRTCLKVTDNLQSLFNNSSDLPYKIEAISSIQVSETDNLPSKICELCERNVHLLFDFRIIIIRSNSMLLKRAKPDSPKQVDTPVKVETETVWLDTEASLSDTHDSSDLRIPECYKPETESAALDAEASLTKYVTLASNKENQTIPNKRVTKRVRRTVHVCLNCNFKSKEYSQLKSHRESHPECINSICNICGKTIRADNLKRHILTHSEATVNCKECGKTFKNNESLRSHEPVHKGIKLQCAICGKVYQYRSGYRLHMQRHELGGVKTVKCPLCSKLFHHKGFLKKHIRSHTGERPYPCKYCKKSFSSSFARTTHVRQHTNEKPYACQLCPAAFPQKVSLKTHLKSKHPTETAVL